VRRLFSFLAEIFEPEMLLVNTNQTFQQVQDQTFRPFVIIPASRPEEGRDQSKKRANNLVVTGRIERRGMMVLESSAGDIFVLAADNESQCVGFARTQTACSKTAADWFLFLNSDGTLVLEGTHKSGTTCHIDRNGFTLPDGHRFEIVACFA
jgi:hypothetical protein